MVFLMMKNEPSVERLGVNGKNSGHLAKYLYHNHKLVFMVFHKCKLKRDMIEMCLIINLLFQIKLYMCIYYNKLFCDVFINVLYIIILQSLYTQWSICYLILVKNYIRLELIMS